MFLYISRNDRSPSPFEYTEMSKFRINDVVQFIGNKKDYKIIRVYKSKDETYKYDVQSLNGKELIIAMPENVFEKVVK